MAKRKKTSARKNARAYTNYAKGKKKGTFYKRPRKAGKFDGKSPLIWDLYFPRGASAHEVDEIVSSINPPIKKFPFRGGIDRTQVKINMVTRDGKKRSAVSYIYKDLWDVYDINFTILDVIYRTFFTPLKRQSKSEKQVRTGSIVRITVDFETSV